MSKEHPILFSGPLVRAILAGEKTQTRRLMAKLPSSRSDMAMHHIGLCIHSGKWTFYDENNNCHSCDGGIRCPFGQPGDRLWVREAFGFSSRGDLHFRADAGGRRGRWSPSIHMTRRISRISLEVTEVRVQRVQEITEEDARAEGLPSGWYDGKDLFSVAPSSAGGSQWHLSARMRFEFLWKETHGRESWGANPWVWAVSFRCVL